MTHSRTPAGINRRELILSGAAAAAGTAIAGLALPARAESVPRRTLEIPGMEELVAENMPRGFSLAELQRRFEGRRSASLDSTDWLDHPGAELIFHGGSR